MSAADEAIGVFIQERRLARGMSQTDLGALMGTYGLKQLDYQQTILKIEKGQRALRFPEAAAMAHALGFTLDDLVKVAPPAQRKPEEPIGDGAVAEDRQGSIWVRIDEVHWASSASPGNTQTWDELDAVRVLFKGVLR